MNLVDRLADDLDAAFPDLVRELQDGLFSGALRLTGNRADAEEITQDAFARAYRALQAYPPDRIRALKLSGWLWTIAINLCRNQARGAARHPVVLAGDGIGTQVDHRPGPEQLALDAEPPLARQLATLPVPMRSAVVLRHVAGLSYAEAAEVLGRPEGTVKADVHRGLERLRRLLLEVAP
jgi:RNA polymerase sigma factor (sigma-70 family)